MTHPSIGVFDSGVGGLSVLREIRRQMPNVALIYFADQDHVPYGSRTLDEVRTLSEGITQFLIEQECELIVVACNTASAAALHSLRSSFQGIPFVGMEPAVKPAAERTETRRVAVLATPATFQGELFASVVDRYASGVEVVELVAPGLVELIEVGQTDSVPVEEILKRSLGPVIDQGIDALALACTHYSFVIPTIRQVLGADIAIIDPAPAVARQAERLWDHEGAEAGVRYITSGNPSGFRSALFKLIEEDRDAEPASWKTGSLKLNSS